MNSNHCSLFCSLALMSVPLLVSAQNPQSAPHSHHVEASVHHPHSHHYQVVPASDSKDEYYVATQDQVNEILKYIKTFSFDSEKLKAAKVCISICPIAAADIASILNSLTFNDAKIDFAKFAFEYCPDKENYALVIKKLSFPSTRCEVVTNCVSNCPMYSHEIARLVSKCLSFDDDRLKVLKAAYPNCIDKENYAVTFKVFTSSTYKTDLRAFMKGVDARAQAAEIEDKL